MLVPTNVLVGVYSGFSRVANPQGNGFAVEAFPARSFTSSKLVANGIRRLAATGGAPAFQTNCFIGVVGNVDPTTPAVVTTVNYTIFDPNNQTLGTGSVVLSAGQITRLLDVFTAAGIPTGDVDNAAIRFDAGNNSSSGVIAFCTVQDNTSFGADFRIAKQEGAPGGEDAGPGLLLTGPWDDRDRREVWVDHDSLGRPFEINAGNSSNTHVIYAHHPDYLFCEIINPTTGVRALPAYGLEIRAVDPSTESTGLGGNDSVVVPDFTKGESVFIGDRANDNGGDGRGVLEVESNEQNTAQVRPYKLHCRSGSGISLGDIIRYKEVIDRF
jgi:hypothetical protein